MKTGQKVIQDEDKAGNQVRTVMGIDNVGRYYLVQCRANVLNKNGD
jgi:hypothetical protein